MAITFVEHKVHDSRNTRYALIGGVIYVQYWNRTEGYYYEWKRELSESQQDKTAVVWEMIKNASQAVRENGHLV